MAEKKIEVTTKEEREYYVDQNGLVHFNRDECLEQN